MNRSSRVKYRSTGAQCPKEYRFASCSFWKAFMRNTAIRSNLLVPEIREVMDIRQASNYLGIFADTLYKYTQVAFQRRAPATAGAHQQTRQPVSARPAGGSGAECGAA